ncbi:hypothetical protein WJX74_003366 [Apatococcus lobatus]|uniref:Uncharacterized protein n=1 Tax=Apatococcus lobatus TaxID=904363 RepID=A0AAW1QBW0_9CHLO
MNGAEGPPTPEPRNSSIRDVGTSASGSRPSALGNGSLVMTTPFDQDAQAAHREGPPQLSKPPTPIGSRAAHSPQSLQTPAAASPWSQQGLMLAQMGSREWPQIRDACGITVRAVESLQYSASKAVDGFAWDDRPELSQIHHSRLQLEICLPLGPNLSWYRMHQEPESLSVDNPLGFPFRIRGTCDMAVCQRAAARSFCPSSGLRALFQLRKRVTHDDACQAFTQLLLANLLCGHLGPIAVTTDLSEHWCVHWLEGLTIYTHTTEDRATAVALLSELLEGERPCAEALASMRAAAVLAESAEALTGDLRDRRDSSKSKKGQRSTALSSSGSAGEGHPNQPPLWGNANFQAALAKRASVKSDPNLLRDLAHMSSIGHVGPTMQLGRTTSNGTTSPQPSTPS